MSEKFQQLSEVPQGSTLWPLLLTVFLNGIVVNIKDITVLMNAKDLKLLMEIRSTNNYKVLQKFLDRCQNSSLPLIPEKLCFTLEYIS